jgi:CRP-like cAMP-binding protein
MVRIRSRKNEQVAMLRKVELFKGCSKAELGRISSLMTEEGAAAGDVLTKQGTPGMQAFVVIDGQATASRNGKAIAKLGRGSLFGELALLDGETRTATIVADTDMTLLVLSRREFSSLLAMAPSVSRKIIGELGARLRRTDELLDTSPTAAKRFGPLSV